MRTNLSDGLLVLSFLGLSVGFARAGGGTDFGLASLAAPAAVGLGVLAGLRFQMAGAIGAGSLLILIWAFVALSPFAAADSPPLGHAAGLAALVAGFSAVAALVVGYERRSVALSDRERRLLKKIFNALPIGVWLRAQDGRSVFVNERWAEFSHQSVEQIMASSGASGSVDLGPGWDLEMDEMLRSSDSGVHYRSLELQDRQQKTCNLTLLSLLIFIDPLGEMGTLSLLIDETALRLYEDQVRKSERGLRLALDSAGMGFWDENLETGEATGDANWFGLLGMPYVENTNPLKVWEERLHPDDRGRIKRAYDLFFQRGEGTLRLDYRLKHDSGRYIWVQDCVCVMDRSPEGHPRQLMGTMQDITERKRTEADLEQARDRAESANAAKSQFIAVISHEIRTPLNAILGMSQFLQEYEVDDERREMAEVIHSSGERLLSMVNDILDFSKVEAGRLLLDAEEYPVRLLFEDCVKLFRQRANQKSLELILEIAEDIPEFMLGDMERVRQITQNLIANAIKFTDSGEVRISVRLTSLEALSPAVWPDSGKPIGYLDDVDRAYLQVLVKDTGIGIAPDCHRLLFEAFTQVDLSSTRKQGGTGLGLAICKRLVQAMGGSIWVESNAGAGATFGFVVRAGLAEAADLSPADAPPAKW